MVPTELRDDLRRLGVTVVTQPHFVAERGDQYLVDVDPDDQPLLYPCASLRAAGVAVAAGTDAPSAGPTRGPPCGPPSTGGRRRARCSGRRAGRPGDGAGAVPRPPGRPRRPAPGRAGRSPPTCASSTARWRRPRRAPCDEDVRPVVATLVGGTVITG